ncbi:hypothetical protein GDO81_005924 [Engystomops pustulosus]|uniref:Uncharacterized protein n=1 Tax=Engystomops pustulosus TaxID=76066 RepID=A0AAV7CT69_ENGPU|nr:hypothetical protein GDO81_005924 [Engystomops pustulosus]
MALKCEDNPARPRPLPVPALPARSSIAYTHMHRTSPASPTNTPVDISPVFFPFLFPPVFTLPTPFQAAPMRPGSEEQALPVARIRPHSEAQHRRRRTTWSQPSPERRDAPPGKLELRAPDGTNQRFPQPTLRSLPGTGNH